MLFSRLSPFLTAPGLPILAAAAPAPTPASATKNLKMFTQIINIFFTELSLVGKYKYEFLLSLNMLKC